MECWPNHSSHTIVGSRRGAIRLWIEYTLIPHTIGYLLRILFGTKMV